MLSTRSNPPGAKWRNQTAMQYSYASGYDLLHSTFEVDIDAFVSYVCSCIQDNTKGLDDRLRDVPLCPSGYILVQAAAGVVG